MKNTGLVWIYKCDCLNDGEDYLLDELEEMNARQECDWEVTINHYSYEGQNLHIENPVNLFTIEDNNNKDSFVVYCSGDKSVFL